MCLKKKNVRKVEVVDIFFSPPLPWGRRCCTGTTTDTETCFCVPGFRSFIFLLFFLSLFLSIYLAKQLCSAFPLLQIHFLMALGYTMEEPWSCWFWSIGLSLKRWNFLLPLLIDLAASVLCCSQSFTGCLCQALSWRTPGAPALGRRSPFFPSPARGKTTSLQGPPRPFSYPRSAGATAFRITGWVIPQKCSYSSAHTYLPFPSTKFLSSKFRLRDTRICAVAATSLFCNNISQASAFFFFPSPTCQFDT